MPRSPAPEDVAAASLRFRPMQRRPGSLGEPKLQPYPDACSRPDTVTGAMEGAVDDGPVTHENELTTPVDLCTPDGDRLNRAALGWSRRPLHRANLEGRFGINKRWDYWAVLAGDLVVSLVYADIDHFGLSDVWWADLATGTSGGNGFLTVDRGVVVLPDRP